MSDLTELFEVMGHKEVARATIDAHLYYNTPTLAEKIAEADALIDMQERMQQMVRENLALKQQVYQVVQFAIKLSDELAKTQRELAQYRKTQQ
ncbi:MAG: hypothetical protein AB1489_29355 [Acidobacteriota bacterium]